MGNGGSYASPTYKLKEQSVLTDMTIYHISF